MSEDIDPELMQMMEGTEPSPPPEDKLVRLTKAAALLRDLKRTKDDQENALKETNIRIRKAEFEVLPDMMDEVNLPAITLGAEGNLPAYELTVGPYYHANIQAEWDEEKRRRAFDLLDERGDGDLIKTEVTVIFKREDRDEALNFAEQMVKDGYTIKTKENVPWATLTSWLKERIEKRGDYPQPNELEALGATVARIVRMKVKD